MMTKMDKRPLSGIDELRRTVNLLNNTREDFLHRFTAEELLKIGRAYRASEWDITPDEWTEGQIKAALKTGEAPRWTEVDGRYEPVTPRTIAN